jgi:hypothetical protein
MTGVPLLPAELANHLVAIEIAWGADLTADPATWTWTDITTDVQFSQPLTITPMGRSNEFTTAQPAGCQLLVANTGGKYSRGPQSPNYPNVRRNTPLRVRISRNNGASWWIRFWGGITGFNPRTNTRGRIPQVVITANGTMRRLSIRAARLRTPMYRALISPAPLAGWLFDDGPNADSAASLLPSSTAVAVPAGGAVLGVTDNVPGGTTAVAQLTNTGTARIDGPVPAYTATGYLGIRLWVRMSGDPGGNIADALSIPMSGGTISVITLSVWGATLGFLGLGGGQVAYTHGADGSQFVTATGFAGLGIDVADGHWHEFYASITGAGVSPVARLYLDGHLAATLTLTGETLGTATEWRLVGNRDLPTAITLWHCGLTIYTDSTAAPAYDAGIGWVGETATDRMARLCDEEGEIIAVSGTSDTTMGAQGTDTLLNLLRECESTDGGMLYDGLGPGLGYITRAARYNIAATMTLDATTSQIDDPFAPVDDDQGVQNLVTVKRKGGSEATAEDQDGPQGTNVIGTYAVGPTVNTATDAVLPDHAHWRLHLGTVDEPYRYPSVGQNFRASPGNVGSWLSTGLLARIDLVGISTVTPEYPAGTVSLVLEGYTETITPYEWTTVGNFSPYLPWRVIELNDFEYALRAETNGSTLAAGAAAGATSLSVAFTGTRWVRAADSGSLPFDVEIGGRQITVTVVTGTTSPQTFTVAAIPAALASGAAVKLWRPPVLAL